MKTKINFKTLLVVVILLITMCVFNANVVQAVETKQEETKTNTDTATSAVKAKTTDTATKQSNATETTAKETTNNTKTETEKTKTIETKKKVKPNKDTLNLIPNTMNVSIKEVEFKKLEEQGNELEKSIRKILADNNVDMTNYNLSVSRDIWRGGDCDIHKFIVFIISDSKWLENGTWGSDFSAEKTITVKYSNTDNYNENDKKAVANIMNNMSIDTIWRYETIEERENNKEGLETMWQKDVDELVSPLVKGARCVWEFTTAYGNGISSGATLKCYFFKNDVCYGFKDVDFRYSYDIVVPENVRDTEQAYIDYAKEYLKNNLDYDVSSCIIKYNRNIQQYEIFDGEEWIDWIHIGKKDVIKVCDGITVASNANVTLLAETIKNDSSTYSEMQNVAKEKGYTNIFNAYELKLSSGKIGKDGLTLRFDLGTENNGKQAIVLHKKQDGTIEEFIKNVENGRISITVSELSPFMVALKDGNASSSNNSNSSKSKVLDDEPKTGVENYAIISSLMAIISLGGIIKH